jgi:hypothetical protein
VRVKLDISAGRRTKWYEYVIRFAVGGAVTVVAALIAKRFGPVIGGLFLAFPAIFPSTATLIASHEKQKKAEAGMSGSLRAHQLAGADAVGAAMGGVGLVAFAAAAWWAVPVHSTIFVQAAATLAWLVVSLVMWSTREFVWRRLGRRTARAVTGYGRHESSSVHNRSSDE